MKAGDKVICISHIGNYDQYGHMATNVPIKDEIYTVESVTNVWGIICLRLVEFPGLWVFKAEAFRKVEPTQSLTKELALEAMKDRESQKTKVKELELLPID